MTAKKTVASDVREIKVISLDDMTYGEIEAFEDIVGFLPTDGDMAKVPVGKMMIALGYITARRDDPSVTVDDIRALPVGSIVMAEAEVNP
jgi:hypothetical protein